MSDPRATAPDHSLRFTLVPASYVYLMRGGGAATQVLLQRRGATGYMENHWAAAAAGHVERGETAYAAAQREAVEELGVCDLDLAFVTSMQRTQLGDPIDERIDFFFTSRGWSGTPRIMEPRKCLELRWCTLADLPDPVVPHERRVLEGLMDPLPAYTSHGFPSAMPTPAPAPTSGVTR